MNDENEVIPLDKLARVYRKIYTKVQDLTKEYESQVEELKAKQDERPNDGARYFICENRRGHYYLVTENTLLHKRLGFIQAVCNRA